MEVLLMCVFWIGVFFLLENIAIPVLLNNSKWYKSLEHPSQLEFTSRSLATLHGILISMVSLYVLYFEFPTTPSTHNTLFFMPPLGLLVNKIILSYYVADFALTLMFRWMRPLGQNAHRPSYRDSWQMYLHHVATIAPFLVTYLWGQLGKFLLICSLCETTTFFTNFHWLLSKVGYRKSALFRLNAGLGALFYFVFRLASLSMLVLTSPWREIFLSVHPVVYIVTSLSTFTIFLLSLKWFWALLLHAIQSSN